MTRKFFGNVVVCLTVFAGLSTTKAEAQSNCPPGVQQQINQLDQQAAVYRQYLNSYCGDQRLQQFCAQIRTWLQSTYPAQRQRLLSQCGTTQPPTQPGCNKDFCGEAQRRGQGLLQSFQSLPNRYAYTYRIEFSYRPVYQSQCQWIPSNNGYTVSGWEFQRTISSLANRCNLVTRVQYSR